MKRLKMGKRIRSAIILAALLVAGAVCIPPKEVMPIPPVITLEEISAGEEIPLQVKVARWAFELDYEFTSLEEISGGLIAMEVENIDEQGKVFAYGEEIQLQVKVALWVFEHEDYDFSSLISGKKLTVVWPEKYDTGKWFAYRKSHQATFDLDESYVQNRDDHFSAQAWFDGNLNVPLDSSEWKQVNVTFRMKKFNIPKSGEIKVSFSDLYQIGSPKFHDEEEFFIWNPGLGFYSLKNICLRYEKEEDGIRIYTYDPEEEQ